MQISESPSGTNWINEEEKSSWRDKLGLRLHHAAGVLIERQFYVHVSEIPSENGNFMLEPLQIRVLQSSATWLTGCGWDYVPGPFGQG